MDITSFLIGKEVGGGSAPTPTYQDKEITITQNGEQTITADSGYDALSSVEITTNVPQPSGKITITENGNNIDVSSYATADVSVGGGVSDYFTSTISSSESTNTPGYSNTIKKFPNYSVDGTSLKKGFSGFNFANKSLPIITNINQVTDFEYCFGFCNFNTLDFSNYTFSSNTNNFKYLFQNSTGNEINLSSLGQINVAVDCQNMFGSSNVSKIDLSNFEPTVSFSGTRMFQRCGNLTYLDISKIDFAKCTSSSYMFEAVSTNCLIYVKDQTQKDWFTTNWSGLTNVQIKSEYIANQGA